MSFNKSQETAIVHKHGPMMVLAGPGSGKTTVITHRTKYLIDTYVDPNHILVITFTKAAADEMKKRFLELIGEKTTKVTFGTFHAVFFGILRHAYGYTSQNIIKEEQRHQIFKEIINNLNLELEDEKEFIASIMGEVSLVKNDMIQIDNYYSINCSEEVFRTIYKQYEERLSRLNRIDFDDMLVFCYQLLCERPDILALWQRKFTYILIDEFQDINAIQYKVIKLLSSPKNNLFIVGDDDQSIYRFRGAKPEIMLNFQNDFPNGNQVILDMNYRSTEQVVNASQRLIKNNKFRYEKDIKTYEKKGPEVILKECLTPVDENQEIIKEILRYHRIENIPLSEMAVIYRTNMQPRQLVEKLLEYNIAFRLRDQLPNIFDHWIARDLISYMRISQGERERSLFLNIINRPNRYINRVSLSEENITINELKSHYHGQPWVVERINQLKNDLDMIRRLKPYDAIAYIRETVQYEEYLKQYSAYRKIKLEELLEVLNDIHESTKDFLTFGEWQSHIELYNEEIKKISTRNGQDMKECVSLSTMHSAKGLEFQVVFILDVNEGIIPHEKSTKEEEIEEERRLLYVAMTRSKKYLHLYQIGHRYNKKMEPSRFLQEIFVPKSELIPGKSIKHKTLGIGVIKKIRNNQIEIYFQRSGQTKLLDLDNCLKNNYLVLA